jgi:hypothetical protein
MSGNIFAQSGINVGGLEIFGQHGSMSISIGQTDFATLMNNVNEFSLGVQQPVQKNGFILKQYRECLIFPNPSASHINISTADPDFFMFNYQIYSADARMVSYGENLKVEETIEIAGLPIGLYIVWIRNNKNQNWYCKFLKKE